MTDTPNSHPLHSVSLAYSAGEDASALGRLGHEQGRFRRGITVALWRPEVAPQIGNFLGQLEKRPDILEKLQNAIYGGMISLNQSGEFAIRTVADPNGTYRNVLDDLMQDVGGAEQRHAFIDDHLEKLHAVLNQTPNMNLRGSGDVAYRKEELFRVKAVTATTRSNHLVHPIYDPHADNITEHALFNYGRIGAAFPQPGLHLVNAFRAAASAVIGAFTKRPAKFQYESRKALRRNMLTASPWFLKRGDITIFSRDQVHASPAPRSGATQAHDRLVLVYALTNNLYRNGL